MSVFGVRVRVSVLMMKPARRVDKGSGKLAGKRSQMATLLCCPMRGMVALRAPAASWRTRGVALGSRRAPARAVALRVRAEQDPNAASAGTPAAPTSGSLSKEVRIHARCPSAPVARTPLPACPAFRIAALEGRGSGRRSRRALRMHHAH
jgi:hypothetical protein